MPLAVVITCSRCFTEFDGHFIVGTSADFVREYVKLRGWTVGEKRAEDFCDKCSKKRAQKGGIK